MSGLLTTLARGRYRRISNLGGLRLLAVALALATAAPVVLGAELHFDRLGASRGLDAENITALYQDRAGFLWIGSREGLTFYDGYTFTRFEHDVANPASLSDNGIRTIFEDRAGNIWIGTNTGGLNRLDRATWAFEAFRHDSANPASLSHDSVYAILEDRAGALWVGTQVGLNRFDPKTRTFERLRAADYVMDLREDRDGALWIATFGQGLVRRDPATGEFRNYRNDPRDPRSLAEDRLFTVADGDGDVLWVGTALGLEKMDRRSAVFQRVPLPLAEGGVVGISVDAPGKLWVATSGDGLVEIDTVTGRWIAHRNDPLRDDSLSTNRLSCLAKGSGRLLWVGTWGGGLNLLRIGAAQFSVLREGPSSRGGLTREESTAVYEDPGGRLWLGTFIGRTHWRDPGRVAFETLAPLDVASVDAGPVLAICGSTDGGVWISTAAGLIRVDAAGKTVRRYRHDPARAGGLGPGYVSAIHEDRGGVLWVGTGSGGLHRLAGDGSRFDRFTHDAADPASLSDDYVTVITEDRAGTLWIGTRSGGLNALDRSTGRFTRYAPSAGDDRSLSHHYVTSIFEDARGRLWIATGGGGLDRAERDPSGAVRFVRVTHRDGLIDNNVMSIVEDDDGSLWLGTRRGLGRYDPERGAFAAYGIADGLPGSEFNLGAATLGAREIFLGTTKGVVVIPRGTPFPRPEPFPTRITSLRTLAGPIPGGRPAWERDHLSVAYGEVLFVDFAVLDFRESGGHRYAYRMGGKPGEWIDLSSRRELTFTDLEPGRHTLVVKGRSVEGVWSEAAPPLQIEVIPPFWMTAWFRVAVLLALGGSVLAWHAVRTRSLERRNRRLVALQEELQTAYDRLRGLTRRLEAAKEDERKQIARELHDEMGQALTAAKINVQLLAGLADPEKRERRIADTVELVNRMIDHVRALSLDLRPPLLDELGLIPALQGYVESVAERSGLAIEVAADPMPAGTPAEIEIVAFRIVQEALTNVIRHAGARHVDVEIRVQGEDAAPVLAVTVRDDGSGFDVREALERSARGEHLGLLGILERVRGLGGDAAIDASPGGGTEIRVSVPLRN